MNRSIRELPNQPGVDGAERQFAAIGFFASAGNIVEQPVHFGAGEVGVDHEPRFLLDHFCMSGRAQFVAERRGATILPNDGVMNWFASLAIPPTGGLRWFGMPNRAEILLRAPGRVKRSA